MVEYLKNFGVGLILVGLISAVAVAINFTLSYTGADLFYLFAFGCFIFITYTFGSLARTILFDKRNS